MKKLKYPEYINGVKQIQNPIFRFFIKLWYSAWFRVTFILCPIWLFVLMIILFTIFPKYSDAIRYIGIFCFMLLHILGNVRVNYTNLNKIGLDVDHQPLAGDYNID